MRLREFDEKERLEKANEKLKDYKTAAGADATAADAKGNFARGHKRFKGINAATNRQFDNDAKLAKLKEVAPPGAKAERMVKHIKQGYAKDGKLTPKEKGIAFATAWKAHNAGRVEEGEITKNATGLKHRATDKYGAGDDEPHHYTGGRSGFSEPGKYARDLEHVNKQLVKDLDASMGMIESENLLLSITPVVAGR
jgi:hypothetical protein